MNLLAFLATLIGAAYLIVGGSVFQANSPSGVNRSFFLMTFVLAIWSFAYGFFVSAPTAEDAWTWFRISAVGWTLTPSAIAIFLLQVGGGWRSPWKRALVGLGSMVAFLVLIRTFTGFNSTVTFTHTALGWVDFDNLLSPWYFAYIAHFLAMVILGALDLVRWARTSTDPRAPHLSRLIISVGLMVVILSLFCNTMLPMLNWPVIPGIAPLLCGIWILQLWQAMNRYSFMALTPALAVPEILRTVPDAILLLDATERVVHANPASEQLFGCSQASLQGRLLHDLLPEAPDLAPGNLGQRTANAPIRCLEVPWRTPTDRYQLLALSACRISASDVRMAGYVVIARDITYLEEQEERFRHLAMHDALTNLPNRHLLPDRAQQAMAWARRNRAQVAVIMVDLDRFKEVNDTLGHSAGDLLLQRVAHRLASCVRSCDTVVRMGGDEFLLLLCDLHQPLTAAIVADRVLKTLAEPARLDEDEVHVSGSLGIALFPTDGEDLETLMMKADTALFAVKEKGRNGYQYFTPAMGEAVQQKREMEMALRGALQAGEMQLVYQPMMDFDTGAICSLEALLRWRSPSFGQVPPLQFLPIAEEIGILLDLERWVLRTACLEARRLSDGGHPLSMAVNISSRLLFHADFVHSLAAILQDTGLDPHRLELELKESAVLGDRQEAVRVLTQLREKGIRISIDDFGSGYSSFNQLQSIPIDALKVDRFFMRHAATDPAQSAILAAMVAMAHSLGLQVVVEGVETSDQLTHLHSLSWDPTTRLKCDRVQGYLFSGPVESTALEGLLTR